MIALLRVDDRLLHGQVALSWSKKLKLDTILIANQQAVNDEFTIMTLNLAKPKNVQIIIEDLSDATKLLSSDGMLDKRIMVVVNNVKDAIELIKSFSHIKQLNIGGLREKKNSKKITEYVSFTQEDFALLEEYYHCIDIFIQKIPDDGVLKYEEIR